MVNYVATFLSFLWAYSSDLYIWGITLLGIPAIFLWSLPAKLSLAQRRAFTVAIGVVGIVAGVSNIQQKAKAIEEIRLLINGGGSIPRIETSFENGYLVLAIRNPGKYPQLDFGMEIKDYEWIARRKKECAAIKKVCVDSDFFFGPIISVGGRWTVPKEDRLLLGRYKRIDRRLNAMEFTFDMTTRSDRYFQKSSLVRVGENWRVTNSGAGFIGGVEVSTIPANAAPTTL